MKLVKERRGHALAVYKPKSRRKAKAVQLLRDNRVDFALPADYREGKEIDTAVKTILNSIATARDLEDLKKENSKKSK